MFCPACGAEYREGFTECSDCQVTLVSALPETTGEGRPDLEFESIFDSANPALIGIAKNVLDGAGIEYFAVGENAARIAFGGNPMLGHVRIQVEKSRASEARELLADIMASAEPLGDDEPVEDDDDPRGS